MDDSNSIPAQPDINKITYDIIGAAYEVRLTCGKGLLENYYESALAYELSLKGYRVERQVQVPALYKGVPVKDPYVVDLLVNGVVVVELKSKPYLKTEYFSQLSTYLWLTNKPIGLLINFSAKNFCPGTWNHKKPDYDLGIVRVIRSDDNKRKSNI